VYGTTLYAWSGQDAAQAHLFQARFGCAVPVYTFVPVDRTKHTLVSVNDFIKTKESLATYEHCTLLTVQTVHLNFVCVCEGIQPWTQSQEKRDLGREISRKMWRRHSALRTVLSVSLPTADTKRNTAFFMLPVCAVLYSLVLKKLAVHACFSVEAVSQKVDLSCRLRHPVNENFFRDLIKKIFENCYR
jgi:hypothetical protein